MKTRIIGLRDSTTHCYLTVQRFLNMTCESNRVNRTRKIIFDILSFIDYIYRIINLNNSINLNPIREVITVSQKDYKIAVLPGDGTGPEVVREGVKVFDIAAQKF